MARTDTLGNFLTDVADAIRTKKGTSETILASNFDTEITNLPSGGGTPTFTGAKSLNDYIDSTLSDFQDQMLAVPNTYETDTANEVVLYPPSSEYPYYIIQKKSNGKYRVDWSMVPCIYLEATVLYSMTWGTQTNSVSDYQIKNMLLHTLPNRKQQNSFYYSSDFDTIEECIQAAQTNDTSIYTLTNTGLSYAQYNETNVMPYSNTTIIDARTSGGDYAFLQSRRISSNETIGTS